MRRWQAVLAIVTGGLTIVSAMLHAGAGWPNIRPSLLAASVAPDIIDGLATGWYLGSVSLLAFGVIALLTGVRGLRSGESSTLALAVIAVTLIGFGAAATVAAGFEPHFLIFGLLGARFGASALRVT